MGLKIIAAERRALVRTELFDLSADQDTVILYIRFSLMCNNYALHSLATHKDLDMFSSLILNYVYWYVKTRATLLRSLNLHSTPSWSIPRSIMRGFAQVANLYMAHPMLPCHISKNRLIYADPKVVG